MDAMPERTTELYVKIDIKALSDRRISIPFNEIES